MITKRLFLVSSSELTEDRREFEIFLSRKNRDWVGKGVFVELVIWEDFLDAVSEIRLQEEYNNAIRSSDIFVALFWTKVGRYTAEEFEMAFGQFKSTNKPYIFTYFKNAPIRVSEAIREDLAGLWAFQERLSALGHFYTTYTNTDELNFNFNQQLEILAAKGFIEFDLDGTKIQQQINELQQKLAQISVVVPELAQLPFADAEKAIRGMGLVPEKIEVENSASPGKVFQQDPQAGVAVPRGITVHIFIAKKSSQPLPAARTAVEEQLKDLTSGGARPNERRYYVSYAWADENDPKREEQVDMLCDEAGRRGVNVLRDKTTLFHGDLISEFMRRIGEGDRVFIFLSEKYLRSPYCMFEMFEMWRNSKQNKAEFLRRVRVFTIDGTKIGLPREWLAYTKFWKHEREELRNDIDAVGWADAGEEVIKRYRHMDTFTGNISDVLALFADVVQPRKIEDFIEYGFKDTSPGTTTA
jgi:TIR domain/PASTA domain